MEASHGIGDELRELADQRPARDGGWPESVIAVIAGVLTLPFAALAAFVVCIGGSAHWAVMLTVGAGVPGMVVGLIDRRLGVVTATGAATVLAAPLALSAAVMPEMALPALLLIPSATLGAFAGQRLRQRGAWRLVGVCVVAAMLTGPFALAELQLRWDARRFTRDRLGELEGYIDESMVGLPSAGVTWQQELRRGRHRGLQLTAHWRTETSVAGEGHCELQAVARWQDHKWPVEQCVEDLAFRFEPDESASIDRGDEALRLLEELQVRVDSQELGRTHGNWWTTVEGGPVTVSPSGQVTVEMLHWSD